MDWQGMLQHVLKTVTMMWVMNNVMKTFTGGPKPGASSFHAGAGGQEGNNGLWNGPVRMLWHEGTPMVSFMGEWKGREGGKDAFMLVCKGWFDDGIENCLCVDRYFISQLLNTCHLLELSFPPTRSHSPSLSSSFPPPLIQVLRVYLTEYPDFDRPRDHPSFLLWEERGLTFDWSKGNTREKRMNVSLTGEGGTEGGTEGRREGRREEGRHAMRVRIPQNIHVYMLMRCLEWLLLKSMACGEIITPPLPHLPPPSLLQKQPDRTAASTRMCGSSAMTCLGTTRRAGCGVTRGYVRS